MPLSSESFAASVRELPALSAVVVDLIQSMSNEDMNAEQFAAKLSTDHALTAKTLRLANSSFYGVPRQVVSVHEAISILGMRTVRSVVLAASVSGSFRREQCIGFDFDAFWRHSIGTALCAKALAESTELSPEMAFTAGLLHDIGHLALAVFAGDAFQTTLRYRTQHDCLVREAEQATLGVDHTVIGGSIAEHWHFAPLLVEAVRRHHAPLESAAPDLAGVVHVADNMAHALDLNHEPDEIVPPMNLVIWSALKLNEDICRQIFRRTESQLDELCSALLN